MTVFVCYGTRDECPGCGGWTHAEGRPFVPADGRGVQCSPECYEDLPPARPSDWCPNYGYDRHEHAPDCVAVGEAVTK